MAYSTLCHAILSQKRCKAAPQEPPKSPSRPFPTTTASASQDLPKEPPSSISSPPTTNGIASQNLPQEPPQAIPPTTIGRASLNLPQKAHRDSREPSGNRNATRPSEPPSGFGGTHTHKFNPRIAGTRDSPHHPRIAGTRQHLSLRMELMKLSLPRSLPGASRRPPMSLPGASHPPASVLAGISRKITRCCC